MTVVDEGDQSEQVGQALHGTDRCDAVRATLLYRVPIFSEMGSCVLGRGMKGTIRTRTAAAGA